jgi:hypothetical protein
MSDDSDEDWAGGDVYEGEWMNGKRNGKGTYTSDNGDVLEGEWKDDKKHGKGKLTLANGDVYDGNWENDKKHGIGTCTNNGSGSVHDVVYSHGKELSRKRAPTAIDDPPPKRARSNQAIKTELDHEQSMDDEGNNPTSTDQYEQMKAEVETLKSDLAKEKSLREGMQAQIEALQRNRCGENM